jgi:hypothetical protein
MEQIHDTIDSARDYRGAILADALRRAWAALTHIATSAHADHERNSLPRPASNTVSTGQR